MKIPKTAKVSRDKIYLDDHGNVDDPNDLYSEPENSESDSDLDQTGLGLSDSEEEKSNAESDAEQPHKLARVTKKNPLIDDLDHRDKDLKRQQRVQMWFEKDNLKKLEEDITEDLDLDRLQSDFKRKGVKILGEEEEKQIDRLLMGKKAKRRLKHAKEDEYKSSSDEDSSDDEKDSGFDQETPKKHEIVKKIGGKDGFDVVAKEPKKRPVKLNEEELALGAMMVTSKKRRRELIDASWNRYAFNDENLPDWFVKDELLHMRKEAPVPKELSAEYRRKMEEINVRPIKKVVEAKARKKKRALRRLEKAKKKAESLLENPDVSSQEKVRQIRKMYKKAEDRKPEVKYVVAKRRNAQKRATRPAGVKGRYKMVDLRLKKDKRAVKARDKKSKKR